MTTTIEAPPEAAPCLECGTAGGHVRSENKRPSRMRGLCAACYVASARPRDAAPCLGCGTTGGHVRVGYRRPCRTRGLCAACYEAGRKRQARERAERALPNGEAAPCLECGTTGGYVHKDCIRPGRVKGLCGACHAASRRPLPASVPKNEAAPCRGCGTRHGTIRPGAKRPSRTKGLCATCYDADRKMAKKCARSGRPAVDLANYQARRPSVGPFAWLVERFDDPNHPDRNRIWTDDGPIEEDD